MKKLALLASAALAVGTIGSAQAATYKVTYTGTDLTTTASFLFKTSNTLNALGGYDVTSVNGTVGTDAVTGVAPLNPPGFNTDNTYYASAPAFSNAGLGFTSATTTYNLFSTSPTNFSLYGTTNGGGSYVPASDFGSISISVVPEPAAWLMMIGGFGLAGAAMRRHQTVRVAYA